jgi:RNA polymerase sigma factor (sigma-70 family)
MGSRSGSFRGLLPRYTWTGPKPDPLEHDVPDGGLIRQIVKKYAWPHWDPEDAFQECCVARIQALRTYNPAKGAWTTWLWFYCRNRLWSRHTRVKRQERVMGTPSYLDDPCFDLVPDRNEAGTWAEDAEAIERAIGRLGDRERDVVLRRFWGGETLKEIGASMDPPLCRERVRQITDGALAKLRAALE